MSTSGAGCTIARGARQPRPRVHSHRHPSWIVFILAWLACPLAAAPRFAPADEDVARVVALIDRRLGVMPEVAAFKFRWHQPVSDPVRERAVIEQSVAQARAMHLDAEAARAFFSAQIAVARDVEETLIARWGAGGGRPPPGRDLARELRPELDAIGRELLPAVYLASPALAGQPPLRLEARLRGLLRYPGTTEGSLAELARSLTALRITADPDWDTLQRTGVLRVGTTGDYAPFSEDRRGSLRGLDIELAQGLARSWGLRVEFVPTSWPTLMDDLRARKFDVALSGISVTPERCRLADFSAPYYFDGKMPIARRENAARFSSLARIDQPGVRVMENPGGTNERFAREHLHRATIVLYPDNRTIFDALVAGRADVMITDGLEVRLQERRHPELQATLAEPLTRSPKAALIPPASDLADRVNVWLAGHASSGQIASLLAQQLGSASDVR